MEPGPIPFGTEKQTASAECLFHFSYDLWPGHLVGHLYRYNAQTVLVFQNPWAYSLDICRSSRRYLPQRPKGLEDSAQGSYVFSVRMSKKLSEGSTGDCNVELQHRLEVYATLLSGVQNDFSMAPLPGGPRTNGEYATH